MNYLLKTPTQRKAPQGVPIPGREMEMSRNNAGGYAFKADSWQRLDRWLILGSEGGTYYVGESDLTSQNVSNVRACIAADGARAVQTIVAMSEAGRAPKNDPAIYALALAASYGLDVRVRQAALDALPRVCRTGTHLFTFAAFVNGMRGWGPALRRAVGRWYMDRPADKLAYQMVKYQQRGGWSHRDLLRLAHPNPRTDEQKRMFGWATGKEVKLEPGSLLEAFEEAKRGDERTCARLIQERGLTREMIPTEHQKSPIVWEALLDKMPPTAMVRTLGRMGACGLLTPLSEAARLVTARLGDRERMRAARVHPIQVLSASLTYEMGHGQRGSLTWPVVPQVVGALNEAFYAAFDNVEPTGKRFYLGVDVSGSMTGGEGAGIVGLTPNAGAAAMAMLIARTEPNYFIGGFSDRFVDLGITAHDRLGDAMQKCRRNFGGTDCAVAMAHALHNRYPVDVFVVITDGETWAGDTHTCQAIQQYRRQTGLDTKLVVINMVANRTRLTDPTDAGSLDVVGFDASVPTLIAEFLGARSAGSQDD